MKTAVFRADSSVAIGAGHVMRCLTLADRMAEAGYCSTFVVAEILDNLASLIQAKGHTLNRISLSDAGPVPPYAETAFQDWPWAADAENTKLAFSEAQPDWIIVDHYGLDQRWESAMRSSCIRMMVIDDLANRRHDCEVLLDQNLGRLAGDYDGLVPESAILLVGPHYALLRPEFAENRLTCLTGRTEGRLRNLLVSMGGTDPHRTAERIAELLASDSRLGAVAVTFVAGDETRAENLRHLVKSRNLNATVLSNVDAMATLMKNADLAIGASGSTNWERCCLGLPTLLLTMADNQIPSANALHSAGAAIHIGDIRDKGWQPALCRALIGLYSQPEQVSRMAQKASLICDGRGAERVACVLSNDLVLRRAGEGDIDFVWNLRQQLTGTNGIRTKIHSDGYDHHAKWMHHRLRRTESMFLIAENFGRPVGYVRFDVVEGESSWSSSLAINPEFQGKGIGGIILDLACFKAETLNMTPIKATIHKSNLASRRVFERSGFVDAGLPETSDGYVGYIRRTSTNVKNHDSRN